MTSIFSGFGQLQRALDYHLTRHNVLSSNLANVDTPGFRALELTRAEDPKGGIGMVTMAQTREGHLAVAPVGLNGVAGEDVVTEERAVPPGTDGNDVSLEREMSKLAANDIRYESVSKVVSRRLAMLRYAANDGTGG